MIIPYKSYKHSITCSWDMLRYRESRTDRQMHRRPENITPPPRSERAERIFCITILPRGGYPLKSQWPGKEGISQSESRGQGLLSTWYNATTTMLHCGDGILSLMSSIGFPPNVALFTKKLNFGFVRLENLFPCLPSLQPDLRQTLKGFHMACHCCLKASFVECSGYGCPEMWISQLFQSYFGMWPS